MKDPDNDLHAARGILNGLLFSVPLWIILGIILFVVISWS